MAHDDTSTTRRAVLRAVGGATATAATGGLAAGARDELTRVNVGYSAASGRRAALDAADEVVYDFAFDALTLQLPASAMAGLAARPDVRYVEEDGRSRVLGQTESWGYDRIDADDANAVGHTGAGVDVAIIDTGIDPNHQDLEPNLGTGKAFVTCSGTCSEPWDDDYNDGGHGTFVAGIVGAVDDGDGTVGVAPDVTLHAVKVCDEDDCSDSDQAAGIEWAADQGHDVANVSIGGDKASVEADAIDYADDRGVLMVAAAGNESEDVDGLCSDCVTYPARDPDVIAVSALDRDDTLTSISSTGPEVELTAPGTGVEATAPGGGSDSFGGTSAAAPHVAGVGALLVAGPYTEGEARGRMRETAEDLGLSSDEEGYGLVDAQAAVELDVETEFPTNVGRLSATLEGELADLGEASSVDVYFEWRRDDNSLDWNSTPRQTLTTTGHFDATIDDLFSSTWYEYRAVADASDGDSETGDNQRFQTDGDIEPMGGTTGGS